MSRYRFTAAEKAHYPVSLLRRVLGVSRKAFYAWAERGRSARQRTDARLVEQIIQIHRDARGPYGAPASTPSCATPGCGRAASGSPG